MSHAPPEHLIGVGTIYFGSWMCLMMQPMIVAFDSSQMIETRHLTRVCSDTIRFNIASFTA